MSRGGNILSLPGCALYSFNIFQTAEVLVPRLLISFVLLFTSIVSAQSSATYTGAALASLGKKQVVLHDNTVVKLRLGETLTSRDAQESQVLPLTVLEDVVVDGLVVISKGAPATATITNAGTKRKFGRGGHVTVKLENVQLVDGRKQPLDAELEINGNKNKLVGSRYEIPVDAAVIALNPLLLVVPMGAVTAESGREIALPQGTEVWGYVQGDVALNAASLQAGSPDPATTTPLKKVRLHIATNAGDGDLWVDRAFLSETPADVELTRGLHLIVVRKDQFVVWSYLVDLQGDPLSLEVKLQPKHK